MKIARLLAGLTVLLVACGPDPAAKKYSPGVTDTEIKIGQTTPYSGPASAYSTMAKAETAYFAMINDQGGVNGRKINFISLDDAYSPPRTVEQVRKLVESDRVLLLYHPLGTAPNTAIQKYMNAQKVPQLFLASGATKFTDPQHYPWSMSWQPGYELVARLYAQYLLKSRPDAKIAVLYQNDDFGKDYLKGLHDGLGERAKTMIVGEASYEITDPTVDSQIVSLSGSGADILMSFSTPKFTAMGIRKAYDIGWRPVQFLNTLSSSVTAVLEPAGLAKSVGVVTADYLKDPTDPQWRDDPATREFMAWMKKYNPGADPGDLMNVTGYSIAQTLIQVLMQCGDGLTRENVMRQAANLRGLALPMLLPGIRINTSPTDYAPIEQVRLARFDGKRWVLFGDVLSADTR
ncbi:MAG: ABC transporter substrate-binding protein [Burkholderiales bacterium]